MIITVDPLFLSIKGSMSNYYIRELNGKMIMQRRPTRDKPPTSKQIEWRKEFVKRYCQKK